MRRRSLPRAGKSPQAWDSVNRHTPCDFKVATRDTEVRAYSLLFRNRCCPGASSARGGRIDNDELQKTARPRRGDRRGFEHVDAADGARVRSGEPESAAGEASCGPHPDAGPSTGAAGRKAVGRERPRRPTPVDGGWPRIYDLPSGGSILVYQPQIASWENQTAPRRLQRRLLSRQGRRQAGARHDQDRGRHEGVASPSGWSASSK